MIGSSAQFGNPHPKSPRTAVYSRKLSDLTPSYQDTYRRQARRLRGLYANRPALLHRRLQQLADAEQQEKPAVATPSLTNDSPTAWYFAERVSVHLQAAGILPYSHRIKLLREAERLGIKRFEANLIIAFTQHRHRDLKAPAPAGPVSTSPAWLLPAAIAVTLQAALVGLLYYALS